MRVCVCGVGSVILALFVNNCFIFLLVESLGKPLAKISSVFVSEDDASVENVKKKELLMKNTNTTLWKFDNCEKLRNNHLLTQLKSINELPITVNKQ